MDTVITLTYRSAAKFYDLFGEKNDLEFYKELALQSGKNALELGVGTARVAIPLAMAGIRVVGIDNSDFMLEEARRKLADETTSVRENVTLRKCDIRNFGLHESFSFIYIPASTFDHCVTSEDRIKCLTCVREHLGDEGRFVFDVEQIQLDRPLTSWWIDRKEIDKDVIVVRSIFTRRNLEKRICNLDLFFDVYKNGKLTERYHEFGEVAILSKKELTDLLKELGFEIETIYGDFDRSPYKPDSPKIILVTKKKWVTQIKD